MGTIEDWRKREELRARLRALEEAYRVVYQAVANAQYEQAGELASATIALVEELGDHFTLTQWPVCLGCFPVPGTAEAGPTDVKATPTMCVDAPGLCAGNQHGRMHPTQLIDFIARLHQQRAATAVQREQERVESQRPDDPPTEDMLPTPPPVPPTVPSPDERD